MIFKKKISPEIFIFFATSLLWCGSAQAYIDPGTGSLVTTAALGFFSAIAYTFRKYMYRLKDFFTRKNPQNEKMK